MRKKWSLNGEWFFTIDPKGLGEKEEWFINGIKKGKKVTVPHIWQREEEFVHYKGTAWYSRDFNIDNIQKGTKIYLYFGAVDFYARIWLNGQYVGEHEGGFTPFEFDITNYLSETGKNTVTVRVYDPEDNAEIPIGKQGSWYTRVSGIWQDVYIEERTSTFIQNVFIQPDIKNDQIHVTAFLRGDYVKNNKIYYRVKHHLGDETPIEKGAITVDGNVIKRTIPIQSPILWEPKNPHLYDLELSLESKTGKDVFVETFGMREVSYNEGTILLNGKPLYLRGALDQAFYPDTIYVAPSDEFIQNEIKMAKQMGFNMLRKHIKVEIPQYLYWADRMGMLIWAEPPNYIKWTNQAQKRFKQELVNMIKRDYNRPSIIIWSLYNEEWGLEWDLANDKEKQKHVELLYDEIKQLDPTRLICDNSGWTHVKTDINDYHRYFVSPDQDKDWQKDLDEFITGKPEQNFVDGYSENKQPIIISEFGIWGLPSVKKLKEYYDGNEPWWFINQGDDTHQEDYKKPTTAKENFYKYQLDRVFNSFEDLAKHSQKRMFRGVKSIIEEIRKRPSISGYIVTEFTDIEWETNGWLDYLRNPKEGFKHLKDFNSDLVIMVDKVNHNLWSGQKQKLDLVISNHSQLSFDGVIQWSIPETSLRGEIPIVVKGESFVRLPSSITFTTPTVKKAGFYELKLQLIVHGEVLAENKEELTISPTIFPKSIKVYPYRMKQEFVEALKKQKHSIINSFDLADVVVTSYLDEKTLQFAREGGRVFFLAEEGDHLEEKGQFTFRLLPQGESWERTSSFNFVNTNMFKDIPLRKEMGWEVDQLIPQYMVSFSNYNKIGGSNGRIVYMFGNDGLTDCSEIVSGYFQGWIGQLGATILHQHIGKGSVILITWKLKETYGSHPIATQILNSLLEKGFIESKKEETSVVSKC